jgi:glycosyltransferase involved in cell wall biosynthesis
VIVWIINPYGSLPDEAWQEYRSSMLSRALARAGHRAVWWISNFEHRSKTFRSPTWQRRELDDGTSVIVVPTTAYHGHISLPRISSEREFAKRLVEQATRESRPDVVVLAEPALFYGPPVVRWCRKTGVRLVVDVLDLWPELFSVVLPRPLRRLERLAFAPLYARRRRLLRAADGIVGVCRDYLAPATGAGATCPTDVCYLGVPPVRPGDAQPGSAIALPAKPAGETWFVYAGTFGEAYDLGTVADAVRRVLSSGARCRFVFAGAGPLRPTVEALSASHPGAVHFIGTVSPGVLRQVYEACDAGICSYSPGSTVAMPVKLFDYIGAGLPVLNSLTSECGSLVDSSGCGVNYVAGDPGSLAAAMQWCVNSPSKLTECAMASRRLAEQFGADAQHDRFVRFIERVVLDGATGVPRPHRSPATRPFSG